MTNWIAFIWLSSLVYLSHSMAENKIMIISGMHRSGTSLLANWLGKCGLHLGYNLIGATPANKLGHFEDLDIVEFHEQLLSFNDTDLYQGLGDPLRYNEYHIAKAKSLVFLRNQLENQWAWKQPRASLFLRLWKEAAPGAFYFFIFRDPYRVVDSLYNREFNKISVRNAPEEAEKLQEEFIHRKDKLKDSYLSMWLRHNMEILDFVSQLEPESYLLLSLPKLIESDKLVVETLNKEWNFDLKYIPIDEVFKPGLMIKKSDSRFESGLHKKAAEVQEALMRAQSRCLSAFSVFS